MLAEVEGLSDVGTWSISSTSLVDFIAHAKGDPSDTDEAKDVDCDEDFFFLIGSYWTALGKKNTFFQSLLLPVASHSCNKHESCASCGT